MDQENGYGSIFVPLTEGGKYQAMLSPLDAYFSAAGQLGYVGVRLYFAPTAEPTSLIGGALVAGNLAGAVPSSIGSLMDNWQNMEQNIGIAIDAIDHGALMTPDYLSDE